MKKIERDFINNEASKLNVSPSFDECIKGVDIKKKAKEGNKGARIGLRVAIISFASLIILAPILAILILNIGGFGSANSEAPNVPSEVAPNNPGAEGSMVPSEQNPGDSVGPVYLKHPELTINGSLYRYSGKDIHKDDIGELIIELEIGSDLIKAYRVATNSIAISDNDIEYYIYELVK